MNDSDLFEEEDDNELSDDDIALAEFNMNPMYARGFLKREPTKKILYKNKPTNDFFEYYIGSCDDKEFNAVLEHANKLSKVQREMLDKVDQIKKEQKNEEQGENQEIVKINEDSIDVKVLVNGKWIYGSFDHIDNCMTCGEKRLCYENTCPICDGFMSPLEYNKHFPKNDKKSTISDYIDKNQELIKVASDLRKEITVLRTEKQEREDMLKFMYKLMSTKTEFKEDVEITDKEINIIAHIKEVVG